MKGKLAIIQGLLKAAAVALVSEQISKGHGLCGSKTLLAVSLFFAITHDVKF